MLLKEDFKPRTYDRVAYAVAPWVVFTPVPLHTSSPSFVPPGADGCCVIGASLLQPKAPT